MKEKFKKVDQQIRHKKNLMRNFYNLRQNILVIVGCSYELEEVSCADGSFEEHENFLKIHYRPKDFPRSQIRSYVL